MDEASIVRGIGLADGCYRWRLWYAGDIVNERDSYLAADFYQWEDYLMPFYGGYSRYSDLWSDNHGIAFNPYDATDYLPTVNPPETDSTVAWGSSLLWLHGGNC